MTMESMVLDLPIFKSAVVSLDVAFSGIIWGWFVTMNMWAKSISTGIFFVGLYMMKRFPRNSGFYRASIPLIGLIFIGITLLFTWLDLHQMLRVWHMFVFPHLTSMINVGMWFLNLYVVALVLLFWALIKQNDALYDKVMKPGFVFALLATLYTAGIMAQANAREIWQGPTEAMQMILAAAMAGSAILLIVGHFSLNREEKANLAYILGIATLLSFTVYVFEVIFAPQKSEEAAWVIQYITSGDLASFFYTAMVLGYILPMIFVLVCHNSQKQSGLLLAAIVSLIGLWMAKHTWLIAPQMIPLS